MTTTSPPGTRATTATPLASEADLTLTVSAKEHLTDNVVRLTLTHPSGADLPAWSPGAHVDLVLGPDLVRPYSLCSDPADAARWQLAVAREPDGRGGSRFVHEHVAEGAEIRVRGPRNNFPLVPSPRYLFLAGGIGITPILPMLAEAQHRGADWQLVYGGRDRSTMACYEELREGYGERVSLRPQDEHGLLDLERLLGAPQPDTLIYCCGPEGLLQAVQEHCADWPAGALHVERFAPKSPAPNAPNTRDEPFVIELARSGRTVEVSAGQSALEALEAAGVPILSSCREGTCGTCETGVLSGTVDHRDSLLAPEEQAAHDAMFPCVSRAACPRLVLDL
ncbi:PDR/VanB family oxidoreductase [Streptomyces monticola]|uniref:PDR/VanB family oxidoreductase n=1 Tax=Streptomyces monticola TaxID=2666263 RepID=A0ABW2JNM8_9ACTN